MKKALVLAILALAAVSSFARDSKTDVLPVSSEVLTHPVRSSPDVARGPRIDQSTQTEIFILRRHTLPPNDPTFDHAEYYLSSGAMDDTFAVYLEPAALCSLHWAQEEWYNAGTVKAFLWEPNPDWLAAYPRGYATLPDEARGIVSQSPIGDVIAGPLESTSNGYGFTYLFDEAAMDSLKIERPNGEPFLAGFVKTTPDQLPYPLSDNVSDRGYTYTWFGGPWTTSDPDDGSIWGMYSSGLELEIILEVAVSYPYGTPPVLDDLSKLCNTTNGSKTNDITVAIQDPISGWTTDDHAWLVWQVQSGGTTPLDADSVEIYDVDMNNVFLGTIPDLSLSAGDVVNYWASARDDEGNYKSLKDLAKSFEIMPVPDAEARVLWIDEGAFGGNGEYGQGTLEQAMANGGNDWTTVTSYWDAKANNGFDHYLIDSNDWKFILYTGSTAKYMPMYAMDDNPFATYLAGGGGIVLASPDYFYSNGILADAPLEYITGDFAYDVFGLSGGYSDPSDADSVYTGVAGELTGMFVDTPFAIAPLFWDHEGFESNGSMDFLYPNATDTNNLFVSDNDGNIYGVKYTTPDGGKAVFFSFDISQASYYSDTEQTTIAPTQQLTDLVDAIYEYYDTMDTAPETGQSAPAVFSLRPNYPNPFNPATRISFDVPRTGDVTLEVFNMIGQRVAVLQQGVLAPGSYTRNFDGSGLASGTYLCRMSVPGYTQTRKLVLVK